ALPWRRPGRLAHRGAQQSGPCAGRMAYWDFLAGAVRLRPALAGTAGPGQPKTSERLHGDCADVRLRRWWSMVRTVFHLARRGGDRPHRARRFRLARVVGLVDGTRWRRFAGTRRALYPPILEVTVAQLNETIHQPVRLRAMA